MSKVGRFEIEAEIGRGSMGVVYLAQDPRLGRRVALKTFLLPEGLSDEQRREYQERFLREARAAASLSHPGIVTVYDVDWDGENRRPFIAMEYVPDGSLRQRLENGDRLAPTEAFGMATALADALQAAHSAGIVHRDVKPANILMRTSDRAFKIADFGVARCSTSDLTRSGATLGSPAYMSPEQIRGSLVDGRSDLFSLAVILYQALCGERPFAGDDISALAYSIVHETPVPIARRVKGLPDGLDAFFEKALAKDAADRFPDATSFRRALDEVLRSGEARSASGPAGARGTSTRAPGQPRPPAEAAAATPKAEPEPAPLRAGPPRIEEDDGCADETVLDLQTDEPPRPPFFPPPEEPSRRVARPRLLVLAAVALALLGGWWLLAGEEAYLKLDGRSTVVDGELRLLVDGKEVYSRRLASVESTGKGKGLLKKLHPSAGESFEAWIEVRPGKHEVEALVTAAGEESVYRSSVVIDLEDGETRKLKLTAGRSLGALVSLKMN